MVPKELNLLILFINCPTFCSQKGAFSFIITAGSLISCSYLFVPLGTYTFVLMTTIQQQRSSLLKGWPQFCEWVTSTNNRIYVGWFGVLMIPCLLAATTCFIVAFIAAPPVDIDGIREPVAGSFMY